MNKHYKIFSISILLSFFLCLKLSSQAFAASVFLPEYIDKFGVSSHLGDGLANRDNCSAYPLSFCPPHAICSKCFFDSKYKISGCETDYKPSDSACVAKTCSEINAAYKAEIPTNQACTITNTSVRTCYTSCKNIDFSDYPLETCPSGAICTPHPDCGTTAATEGNCSPVKQKVTGCASSTQKPNADETACIDKDDTCPANYFKSCATGTQGSPKYTERGTACYQCKPACSSSYRYDAANCRDPKILAGTECGGKYTACVTPTYLYSNLHSSSELVPNKTVIGVVIDGAKKLAIALNTKREYLSAGYLYVPRISIYGSSYAALQDWAGKVNTTTVLNYCKTNSKSCPVFEYVSTYKTEGTSAGDWHLPAMGELNAIYNNKAVLNSALSKVDGTQLPTDNYHWSSSGDDYYGGVWIQDFSNSFFAVGVNDYLDNYYVRPVLSLEFDDSVKPKCPILYSDMTTSKEIIPGKTPIGVVFDEEKKLAIALEIKKNVSWSSEKFNIPGLKNLTSKLAAEVDWDGKANTATVLSYCKANSKSCPAFEYVSTYKTEGTSAGDWYLPATGELYEISDKSVLLNYTLFAIGKPVITPMWYWSSSQYNNERAWYGNFASWPPLSSYGYKTSADYVLPVINYGSP